MAVQSLRSAQECIKCQPLIPSTSSTGPTLNPQQPHAALSLGTASPLNRERSQPKPNATSTIHHQRRRNFQRAADAIWHRATGEFSPPPSLSKRRLSHHVKAGSARLAKGSEMHYCKCKAPWETSLANGPYRSRTQSVSTASCDD